MDSKKDRLFSAVKQHCRPVTTPVAVKLAKKDDAPLGKMRYPLDQLGHPLAVCQGMSLARTMGWSMAFRKKDHACPFPRVFMGHIDPGNFLQGVAAGFYQDDEECGRIMEASYARWPVNTFDQVWLSPLDRCEFDPDLVVIYGSPAQILSLIQAANFGHGPGIQSMSSGRYGCSNWIAGAVQAGECTYMVPGPGERIFAGTQDSEMSFAIPFARIDRIVEGLNYISRSGAYRYPVPNFGMLAEPRLPKKYNQIDPGN